MCRKLLATITILCFSIIALNAASYNIQLSVSSTQNETCYADGKIVVKLSGTDANVLVPSDQISFNVLRSGISYKQHDLTIADMSSDNTFVLEGYAADTYTIDYTLWIGSTTEIKGSIAAFSVAENVYQEPYITQSLGSNQTLFGTRPSLNCKPTGIIQLEMTQGKFPYKVKVYKNGSLLRTDIFNSPMYTGTNPLAPDYKNYYDITQLAIGSYTFVLEDSCGSVRTLSEPIIVQDVDFKCIANYASLTSYTATQLYFRLSSGFFNNVKYDNYSNQWLEYRYALEGEDFTAWKPYSQTVYTTVASVDSVMGKKYLFELRVKDCTYPVCQAEVLIKKSGSQDPNQNCKEKFSSSVSLVPIPGTGGSAFCSCEGGTPTPVEYDKWQVITTYSLCDPYTLPVTYKWTNVEYPQYTYLNNSIYLASASITSAKYPLSDELYGTQVHIELLDASGVMKFDTVVKIPPKASDPEPVPPVPLSWSLENNLSEDVGCSGLSTGGLSLNVNCGNIPDGATVDMTQTPDGYHFVATYDLASRMWNFVPNSFSDFTLNQSVYTPGECSSSMSVDFNTDFHFGDYVFNITWENLNGTDTTTTISTSIAKDLVRYGIGEELSFTTRKTCQGVYYYPSAQIMTWNEGDETNKTAVLTKFIITSGNVTGYEINGGSASVGLCNKDSLLITKPGQYIIQAFYNPSGASVPDFSLAECTICTDTIDYKAPSLSFEDYYGYLCADTRESSVRGGITVLPKYGSGVPPYKYDLYSGDNDSGTLIGSNNSGVFEDFVVSTSKFFVRVTDQCLSSFVVAIPLSPIIISDVILGDRNVCIGSTASLQGKMIGATNLVSYGWTGSDGFSSNVRQITTPPITESSTYSLEISGLGCHILDSITVEPVTEIKVYYEDLICQGTNYNGGEEYQQSLSTASLPVGIYDFSSGPFPASKGGCDSTTYLTLQIIDENSVLEDTIKICEEQFPFLWQDSLFTTGTPSGIYYKSKSQNSCSYKRALRLTVGHPTSEQFDRTICEGDSVVFNGNIYTESGYYTDSFKTETSCDSIETLHLVVIQPDQTTLNDTVFQGESYDNYGFSFPVQTDLGEKYQSALLKNTYGCDSTVEMYLEVLSPLVNIPEVFTPNGDNKNSFFKIRNINRYPLNHILIFNRWGNKVYEGKPYMNEWDGRNYFGPKIGGDVLPVGTYYYILDLGDGSDVIKGFIYLNR